MFKNQKKAYVIYMLVLIVGLSIDQISKFYFQMLLQNGNKVTIIPTFLELIYVENRGAAFGIFQGGMLFFAFLSIIAVACITWYVKKVSHRLFTVFFLAVISAGALGNMIDRIVHAYVIDFIHFSNIFGYSFPVFNGADIFLTCGLTILCIDYIMHDMKEVEEA